MLLITGGGGGLAKELKKHLDSALFFGKNELNVLNENNICNVLDEWSPSAILHLAAYTSVADAEKNKKLCWDINVIGTANLVSQCIDRNIKLIFVSSDYVFDGYTGNYKPTDCCKPINWYGKTKAAAEQLVSNVPKHLIIRTSFKPLVSLHSKVPGDMWTSADYIDVIAPMIANRLNDNGIVHVGTGRKNLLELVRQRNPDVVEIRRTDIHTVCLPADVSLVEGVK